MMIPHLYWAQCSLNLRVASVEEEGATHCSLPHPPASPFTMFEWEKKIHFFCKGEAHLQNTSMWSVVDCPIRHVNKFGVLIIAYQRECCAHSYASGNTDELNYCPRCLLGPMFNKTDPHQTVFYERTRSGRWLVQHQGFGKCTHYSFLCRYVLYMIFSKQWKVCGKDVFNFVSVFQSMSSFWSQGFLLVCFSFCCCCCLLRGVEWREAMLGIKPRTLRVFGKGTLPPSRVPNPSQGRFYIMKMKLENTLPIQANFYLVIVIRFLKIFKNLSLTETCLTIDAFIGSFFGTLMTLSWQV